ncbi:nucleotidyltransferase family protein [Acuticoccus kandeliae]|uniref:nucleotidyltransferase family protein n=1 Tax=Acuticoccus kandeliae TaxID=2073160 RepID=UPI000D3E6001|nr:nucleotidyltransferase family protein [Acuticoccus kandeliae]
MVLAAGRGTRMRPLTAMTPKPLIEVAGKALIDHVFDRLDAVDVRRIVVNVHYLADLIEVHVRRRAGDRVLISDERKAALDTGGGIVKALPILGDAPFVVANSDTFWIEGASANLPRLLSAFDPDKMDALLLLAPTVGAVGYDGSGDFELSTDGRLKWRRERTVAPFVYAGCAVMSPSVFDGAPEGKFPLTTIFNRLIQEGRLHGLRLDGLWLHVGTPGAIREAERAYFASAA